MPIIKAFRKNIEPIHPLLNGFAAIEGVFLAFFNKENDVFSAINRYLTKEDVLQEDRVVDFYPPNTAEIMKWISENMEE